MPFPIPQLQCAASVFGVILMLLYGYRAVFMIIGCFRTRVFPTAERYHRYGIVVAARNEAAVIGALLDSVRRQDYPADRITVFVVADNCTDRTSSIARAHGAVCYERIHPGKQTKGYALQYLFRCIERDYGTQKFDGFIVLDADNLLSPDYVSRMNDAFDAGERIVTSYRNSKNLGENWISCSYGLHWLGCVRTEHRARSALRLSTRLQGTGYLFDSALVRQGWNYTSLTEDRELTADAIRLGWRISYQDAAVFYDEQPTALRVALRQRLRWSRGHLEIFCKTGGRLLREWMRRCFLPRCRQAAPEDFHRLRDCAIGYDILMTVLPDALLFVIQKLFAIGVGIAAWAAAGFDPAMQSTALLRLGLSLPLSYFATLLLPLYVMLSERRRIPAMSATVRVSGVLLWPIFPLIGSLTTIAALFCRVEWKPIPHHHVLPDSLMEEREITGISGTASSHTGAAGSPLQTSAKAPAKTQPPGTNPPSAFRNPRPSIRQDQKSTQALRIRPPHKP